MQRTVAWGWVICIICKIQSSCFTRAWFFFKRNFGVIGIRAFLTQSVNTCGDVGWLHWRKLWIFRKACFYFQTCSSSYNSSASFLGRTATVATTAMASTRIQEKKSETTNIVLSRRWKLVNVNQKMTRLGWTVSLTITLCTHQH